MTFLRTTTGVTAIAITIRLPAFYLPWLASVGIVTHEFPPRQSTGFSPRVSSRSGGIDRDKSVGPFHEAAAILT